MTATITHPAWTIEFENETIDRLIDKYAPHIPKKRLQEPKAIATAEELENFYHFRVGGAANDLFIVQVTVHRIGNATVKNGVLRW